MKASVSWLLIALAAVPSFASAQNLFEADWYSGNIYEFAPNGARTTFATGLNGVFSLACDNSGDLFASAGSVIYKFTPNGVQSTFNSGLGGALTCDSAGNLYVGSGSSIYKIDPNGVQTTFATGSGLITPYAMAFNSAGNLYVSDYSADRVYQFTPGGAQSTFYDFGGLTAAGLAVDSKGNVFVGTYYGMYNGAIDEITPSGTLTTFASGLYYPDGLVFDNAGNLFESNYGTDSIYEFGLDGTQTNFASGLHDPIGLAYQPVPEPSALALAGLGATALLVLRRNKV
jgi:sugar lactone lactonase YvrE